MRFNVHERMNASSFRHSPSFPLHLQACLDVAVPSKKNKRRSGVEVKERKKGEKEKDLEVFHLLHNAFAQILLLCNFFLQLKNNQTTRGREMKERREEDVNSNCTCADTTIPKHTSRSIRNSRTSGSITKIRRENEKMSKLGKPVLYARGPRDVTRA